MRVLYTGYLYCFHQTLNFQLIQDRGERSDDDVYWDAMNLLDVVGVNRLDVTIIKVRAGFSGHCRLVSMR